MGVNATKTPSCPTKGEPGSADVVSRLVLASQIYFFKICLTIKMINAMKTVVKPYCKVLASDTPSESGISNLSWRFLSVLSVFGSL